MLEIPPKREKNRSFPRSKPMSPEKKAEKLKQIKEREENEKKENVKVTEKLLNQLELLGIKCDRCGSKNVKENKNASEVDLINSHLYCLDCNNKWLEKKYEK